MENINNLSAVVENIGPETARKYLMMNTNNPRKINWHVVHAYAEDMKAGRWVLNGEPICFDENGNLRNGQHRLYAIIRAGVVVQTLVIRNIASGCTLYDYGLKRSITTENQMPSVVGAVATVIVNNAWRNGSAIPRMILTDYMLEHEGDLLEAFRIARTGADKTVCRKRDVVLAVYILLRKNVDKEDISAFCTIANSGLPIDGHECGAPLAFRRNLELWDKRSLRSNVMLHLEYFFRAFNDFKAGVKRTNVYKIRNSDYAERMFEELREADGLTKVD